jgi:YD repeat-containing protein
MAALGAVSASLPVSAVEHLDNWDAFDALDRLVARDVFNHERHEKHATFAYDAVGNLLTASNETASLSFGYDVMDRLTAATTTLSNAVFTAAYARDAGGLVTNLMYAPGRSVARTYDADGRLVSLSDWLGHTWHFAWDGAGKPTGGTSPGGIAATNRYDAAGRLEAWSIGTLAGRTVTRDAAGLKTREDITAGPHPAPAFVRYATNTFDAADRLVAAQVRYGSHTNAAISETYLYDGNGALTSLVSGGESVFTAAYSPLGQLSSLKTYYLAPLRRLHSRQSIWQFLGSVRPPSLQGVM